MTERKDLNKIRQRRKIRSRAKISGTAEHPRISVFRSNNFSYVQLIDDENGKTVVSASTRELSAKDNKVNLAAALGELIAQKAKKNGITKAVFDRGAYKYHGRVKAIAEGARKGGLEF